MAQSSSTVRCLASEMRRMIAIMMNLMMINLLLLLQSGDGG